MPLFEVEPVAWEAPDAGGFDGLLLTSANAVRHGGAAIGGAARTAGLCGRRGNRRGGARRGVRHCRRPARRGSSGCSGSLDGDLRLLHLCGEHRIAVEARQAITAVPVYRSADAAAARRARRARRAGGGGPFAARRPAAGRAGRRGRSAATIRIAAISDAAAAAAGARLGGVRGRRDPRRRAPCWPSPRGCAINRGRMNAAASRTRLSLSAKLLIGLALIIAGAAAATWMLARYDRAAHLLGVAPSPPALVRAPQRLAAPAIAAEARPTRPRRRASPSSRRGSRGSRMKRARRSARPGGPTRWWSPSRPAGRSIAACRSAISRRCWSTASATRHPRAVATIITGSRSPVSLDELVAEYEKLGPELRGGGPQDSWWSNFQRELGSLVDIRRADVPSVKPDARYRRALEPARGGQCRRRAGRDDAAARRATGRAVGRQGAPLHRRPPRARRNGIGGAARRGQYRALSRARSRRPKRAWQGGLANAILRRRGAQRSVQLAPPRYWIDAKVAGSPGVMTSVVEPRSGWALSAIGLSPVERLGGEPIYSAGDDRDHALRAAASQRRRPASARRPICKAASRRSAASSTAASASPSGRSTTAGAPGGRPTSCIRSRASANYGWRSPRSTPPTRAGCGWTTGSA